MSALPTFITQGQHAELEETETSLGLVAKYSSYVWYNFYSPVAVDVAAAAAGVAMTEQLTPSFSTKKGQGFDLYYLSEPAAREALKLTGSKLKSPFQAWTLLATKETVRNVGEKGLEKMDEVVVRTVNTQGNLYAGKGMSLVPFHMLALPSAVAAMANLLGYKTPGFDLSFLMGRDIQVSDEFQAVVCGNPDTGFKDSRLWKMRAALWAALGEPDPNKFRPIGATISNGKPSQAATSSEALSTCLSIFGFWSTWAYTNWVVDPRVSEYFEAKDGSIVHKSIPVMSAVFETEDQALALVRKLEMGEAWVLPEQRQPAVSIVAKPAAPAPSPVPTAPAAPVLHPTMPTAPVIPQPPAPLPGAWANLPPERWFAEVKRFKDQYGNLTRDEAIAKITEAITPPPFGGHFGGASAADIVNAFAQVQ